MRLHLPESQRPISSEFLDLRLFKCHRSSAAHVKLASTDQNILMYPPQGSPWPHMKSESESHSIISDSLRPHGVYSPWNSPGQNNGAGNLSLLQGIFLTQGLNPHLLCLLHCRQILYVLSHQGSVSLSKTKLPRRTALHTQKNQTVHLSYPRFSFRSCYGFSERSARSTLSFLI